VLATVRRLFYLTKKPTGDDTMTQQFALSLHALILLGVALGTSLDFADRSSLGFSELIGLELVTQDGMLTDFGLAYAFDFGVIAIPF